MPLVDQHPLGEELKAFALGRLDDELFAAVEEHVTACSDCEAAVSRISGDTFTALLQSAQSLSDTPKPLVAEATAVEPRRAVSGVTSPGAAAPAEASTALATALANHPRYRPLRLLGSGGMGTVWLAEHRVMGRQVAVKVIRPEFVAKAGAAERFHRETQAAARLHHPNIVTAFDAEQADGTPLLAMEYIDGVSLADELRRRGPLPVGAACDAVRQAALGLQHAHERGLVHRDVKPQNLMRTTDGVVKVLDFGLAVLADVNRNAGLTDGSIIMGTPDYIAPEQAEDARNADVRSDIYALGCTLYHLLTGRVPFPGDSVLRKLDAHRTFKPEPIRNSRPEVPAGLATIVAQMMAKKPSDRYQTPGAVAAALGPFAAGTTPVRRRRRTWVAVAAALLVGIVVAAGVVYRIQTDNGEVVITPESPDVQIVLLKGGKEVEVIDTKTNKRVTVPIGVYDVVVKNKPDGIEVKTDKVVVARGKEVLVTIERVAKATPAEKVGEVRRFKGLDSGVLHIAVSPDGRQALSGGQDWTPRLWDIGSGQEVRRFEGHQAQVYTVAFHPKLRQMVSAGDDRVLRLWDLDTGKELAQFQGHTSTVTDAVFSPDGRQLASSSFDRTVRLWDVATRRELARLEGHKSLVECVAFTPDGSQVLSGSGHWDPNETQDFTLRLWNAATGKLLKRLEGHTAMVRAVAIAADGRRALSGSLDGTARLWDLKTGKELLRLQGSPKGFHGVALAADGRRALTADVDGTISLFDIETGRMLQRFEGHSLVATSVAFLPDGRHALSGGGDRTLRLWRLPDPSPPEKPAPAKTVGAKTVLEGFQDVVWGVAFAPDGKSYIATGGINQLYDRSSGRELRRFPGSGWFATFSPDGRRILTGNNPSTELFVWDAATAKLLKTVPPNVGRILYGEFSPDGQLTISNHWNTVRVRDLQTGMQLAVFECDPDCWHCFQIVPGGQRLLVANPDHSVCVVDMTTWKEVGRWKPHADRITDMAISPDGRTLLVCTNGGQEAAFVWDVASGRKKNGQEALGKSQPGHRRAVFAPDSRRALATNADGTIILWDVTNGKELQRWEKQGDIASVTIAPDGRDALFGLSSQKAFLMRLPEPPPAKDQP